MANLLKPRLNPGVCVNNWDSDKAGRKQQETHIILGTPPRRHAAEHVVGGQISRWSRENYSTLILVTSD